MSHVEIPAGTATGRPQSGPRVISLDKFMAELKAQGVPRDHVALKCPACAHVQSIASLMTFAGLPRDLAEQVVHQECEGRHKPGRGCDWALWGLLHIHTLEVVNDDGRAVPAFEPATEAEAEDLMAEVIKAGGPDA